MGLGVCFWEKPWDAHVLQQWLLSFYSSWNWHKHWIPISPYSTECCSDVPVPAYPPEGSPSLLHLEPQHCLDRCLSPAAHHQLFTWSALLLIRWVIWGVRRAGMLWNLRPERQQGREGQITSPDRERESESSWMLDYRFVHLSPDIQEGV